ncbi:MAG TPA: glycoside hydrolase family 43 protein [Gemmatirosa sp.]|nr:glycoside hydrolase family 43 protein [Gemmatirosa sp.]
MTDPTRRDFLAHLAAGAAVLAGGARDLHALAAGALAAQQPAARTLTYTNPVYAGSLPDPSVIRHRGAYYAFGTTGEDRKADGRVFTVLRSPDLVRWQEVGGALTPPVNGAGVAYWAPEVVEHEGTFYLYYAVGTPAEERMALRVATSRSPEGPYTDTGTPLVECTSNRFAIDAHPVRDVDGQWYLFYARNYPNTEGGFRPGTGLAMDRLVGMTRLAGECRTVLRARHDWTLYEANRRMDVYGQTFDWHTIEGAFVRRHRGRYYCFYSGANWQTERYGVDYAVASRITGPYTGEGRSARVLTGVPGKVRGPGHHSIVEGPDGRDWVCYHAWNADRSVRQLCIDPLEWTAAGPRCTPTVTPRRIGRRA